METMGDLGVTGILEMPPAGTLTGIAKRALKGVETFALKTPDQLDDARAFVDKHGEASPIDTTPTWRMLVSPAKGTFHQSAEAAERDVLAPGAAIGEVASLRDQTAVAAPHGGTVVEWLVEDGDLVSPGQPLVRLHPEGSALMAAIAGGHRRRRTPASSGVGGYRPPGVVTNAEIVERIDSSDEWIQQRSGHHERRWAGPDETVQMMTVAASRNALERAGHRRRPDRLRHRRHRQPPAPDPGRRHRRRPRARHRRARPPSTSPPPAPASATASRWPPTWSAAAAPSTSWSIGVERLTDITDPTDRGTAFIFADGAGAAVVGPSDTPGIGPVVWGSDGAQFDLIRQSEDWRDVVGTDTARLRRDAAPAHAGQPGLPLGVVRDGQDRPAGARRGRDHRSTTSTSSCPTRPTCASSTRWRARSSCPSTS